MAKRNSSNQDYTNNADGWDLTGGTTGRKLTVTGADITLTGSGTAVHTFPATTSTLARTDAGQTFTGTQVITTVDINGGAIDGATIGAASPTTIVGTTIQANTGFLPDADGGAYLGQPTQAFSNLYLDTGGTINFDNGNVVATHSSGILTVGTGDLRVTTAGTNTASVVTVGGTQTLTSKTLTSPTLTSPVLGTPSSGTLTNCTGLPAGSITTGTLAGRINLGEGADTATIGLELDHTLSADERYSGITTPGTAGATIAFGDLCYLDATAGEWLLADADAASTSGDVPLGICVDAAVDGGSTSMLLIGTVRSAAFPASIALGAPVWVSTTAGDITATAPTGTDDVRRRVGWAITTEPNTIYFNPSNDYVTHV